MSEIKPVQKKKSSTGKEKQILKSFFFPKHGVSIAAENMKEAQKLLDKQLSSSGVEKTKADESAGE